MVTSSLREPLSPEQGRLLRTIYEPFGGSGRWPIWQYVDLTLDRELSLDAQDVLASLPVARNPNPAMWSSKYGLTWHQNSHQQPQPDTQIALTVAGLRYIHEAEPLLGAFLTVVQFLVDRQRNLVPSPDKVVEAAVTSAEIADHVLSASIAGRSAPPVDATMLKLRQVLGQEPFLWSAIQQHTSAEKWTVRVPAVLRAYREVANIDDYIDRVLELVAPPAPTTVTLIPGAYDIPNAVGYLDAVWMSRTGSHLFVNLDPASIARLTQECDSEEAFNSLMSALADVLGQVVVPGRAVPPQGGALEAVRDRLTPLLDTDAAARVDAAVATLIRLRHIRVGTQHADARHRAVAAFQGIGLPFPPASWPYAWTHIAALAKGAIDVLREEAHVGL